MTRILSLVTIGIFSLLYGSANAYTPDYFAFVCDDCNAAQAEIIAIQNATPSIQCQPADGSWEIGIGNEQCVSDAKDYLVFSRASGEIYGFTLAHENQGAAAHDMNLSVTHWTPSAQYRDIVAEGTRYYFESAEVMNTIANELSHHFTSPSDTHQGMSTAATHYSQQSQDCLDHPSFRAINTAFSATVRSQLTQQANQEFQGQFGFQTSDFNFVQVSLDQFVFGIFKNIGVALGFESQTRTKPVEYTFGWLDSTLVDSGYQSPKIVFDLVLDHETQTVIPELNRHQSMIEGHTLAKLFNQNNELNAPPMSECAERAFEELFDAHHTDPASGGSGSPMCRKHFYRNGERMITILVPCPTD
ncbi:MAG: hypothetical protein JJU10_03540 [Idiomarina sp.]|nr:hypothetical protein [Idiomarina sp.]